MENSVGTRSKCTAKLLHNDSGMQEVAVEMQTPFRYCFAGNEENTKLRATTVDVSKCERREHSACAKSTPMIQLKARRREKTEFWGGFLEFSGSILEGGSWF